MAIVINPPGGYQHGNMWPVNTLISIDVEVAGVRAVQFSILIKELPML